MVNIVLNEYSLRVSSVADAKTALVTFAQTITKAQREYGTVYLWKSADVVGTVMYDDPTGRSYTLRDFLDGGGLEEAEKDAQYILLGLLANRSISWPADPCYHDIPGATPPHPPTRLDPNPCPMCGLAFTALHSYQLAVSLPSDPVWNCTTIAVDIGHPAPVPVRHASDPSHI